MNRSEQKGTDAGAAAGGNADLAEGAKAGMVQEPCRCKEASNMAPAELLKLMMSDLAFWKKKKE